MEREGNQVLLGEESTGNGMLSVLCYVGNNVENIENGAVGGANGILEGRESEAAAVEGEALEAGYFLRFRPSPFRRPLRLRYVHTVLAMLLLPHSYQLGFYDN